MIELPDPRSFPDPAGATPASARLHALAAASLSAQAQGAADALDAEIDTAWADLVEGGHGDALAAALDSAPSVAIHRHLWRALARVAARALAGNGALGVAIFAVPLVVVTGRGGSGAPMRVPGVLNDPGVLADLLREHRVLGGNETFALSNALVAAEGIGPRSLPGLVAATRLDSATGRFTPVALPRAPIDVPDGESVHLRFIVGSALAAPGFDLGALPGGTAWMRPFAHALAPQLAVPGVSVLALPRPLQPLPAALASGRSAQRDASAQLFASNALRQIRASTGEPVAVISAHVCADAPGGGELRLSLSSPFEPRDAQGFRCPLYPWERVGDVAATLVDLLHDCRVAEIRAVSGVHPDRDAVTGGPLLFKPETVPPGSPVTVH
jgi:hypothetical protein